MLHSLIRVSGFILFLFCLQLSAQTDYRSDLRSEGAARAAVKSRELLNMCVEYYKSGSASADGYNSIKSAHQDLDALLVPFENNSRYRVLLGMCYTMHLHMVARVYQLKGDSALAYRLMLKQLDWIEETFKRENYPVQVVIEGNADQYEEYTQGDLYPIVAQAVGTVLLTSYYKEDWAVTSRSCNLFIDLGLKAEEGERRDIYYKRYQALQNLNVPLTERLDWLRKTMLYYQSTMGSGKNWNSSGADLSMEFYNLLQAWKRAGQKNSQSDLMLAAKALRGMNHLKEADNVYREVLTETGLLNFDNTITIVDFYTAQDKKDQAIAALKRVNADNLGCVDLSVIGRRYRELGDLQSAEEFEKRYRKCMRDHKKWQRWQRRQDNFDLWGWLKEGWKEKANLSVSVNPLAGLNNDMGRKGGVFKYIPMSADLRTGAFLHEFRWNRFMYYNGSERFTRGNLVEPKIENEITNEWNSLRGNDYSYYLGIVAHRTEDEGYNPRWKGYHAFGVQYLWGNFESDEEVASVLFKGNTVAQDVRIRPTIYRYEWLLQWKYSRFYTKWFYYTLFIGAGTGQRSLSYNSPDPGIAEGQLMSSTETTFYDTRLVQSNWIGRKLTFRAGFRVGITIK